ncbi:HAD family phosphatase [Streptomyces sp. NPDC058459]|uniref:HAD family phosphatase n=1 Tax=Streptomyces sp. NPDC058459 TaxID=3346508 RepID=UPI003660F3CA
MPTDLQHLRLAAVNIDGVLLNDTFSPVIRQVVLGLGGQYTAEVEHTLFSQPQTVAAQAFARAARLPQSPQELVDAYFRERERYLTRHPVRVQDGAADLLALLRGLGLRLVCYGGLNRTHFERHLGPLARLFDLPGYVCTDKFRPGIREITRDICGLDYDQVVFIDDVARVAEAARQLGVPFIGRPGEFEHGHQRALMKRAGVRHLVPTLRDIDEELLRTLDAEAAAGTYWDDARLVAAASDREDGSRA